MRSLDVVLRGWVVTVTFPCSPWLLQAVICATGYTGFNPSGFGQVDETGTKNLIDAAKAVSLTAPRWPTGWHVCWIA
jgi:hypothetical protein